MIRRHLHTPRFHEFLLFIYNLPSYKKAWKIFTKRQTIWEDKANERKVFLVFIFKEEA